MDGLARLHPGLKFEFVFVTTTGDKVQDVSLSKIGGKGLFVSEIEQTLLRGEADLAVHSLKDVPVRIAAGLCLGGTPARFDVRDVLVSGSGATLMNLPPGAVVGTSSLRRAAQVRRMRPDVQVEPLRGNIDTRLAKVADGSVDAAILAAAGLERMGWQDKVTEYLQPETFIPAIGQGILSIECRDDDSFMKGILDAFTDSQTLAASVAERTLLEQLSGDCTVPLGGYAKVLSDGRIHLIGMVAAEDGTNVLRAEASSHNARQLGVEVADKLKDSGAADLLGWASGGSQ